MQVKTSTLISRYGTYTKDKTAENIAIGKEQLNFHYTEVMAMCNNYIVERTKYGNSKANQRSYLLFPDLIKIKTIRFYDGATWNPVEEVVSMQRWHELTATNYYVSIPTHWILINEQGNMHLELDGIPDADATGNIEIVYEGYQDPLYFPADYVTGTIALTKGNPTIQGTGVAFTAAMIGRFLQPTSGKYWYDIKSFTDADTMLLVNNFQEESVSGVGFTIAELLRLPSEFSFTPLWGAVRDYYLPINAEKAAVWEGLYKRDIAKIEAKYKSKSLGAVMPGISLSGPSYQVPRNYPHGLLTKI